MKLPSIAFVLEVVENPPTAAAARPARPVAPPASGGGAQPARPPASGASLPSTGGALSWPIAGALLLVGAVALRRRRRLG
jgi:LPXTG-motif cell wall-anchored protein